MLSEGSDDRKEKENLNRRLTFRVEGDWHSPLGIWSTGKEKGTVHFPDDEAMRTAGTPKSIDLVRTFKSVAVQTLEGQTAYVHDNSQVTYLGIYGIEGDTLRLCHDNGKGKTRPRVFASSHGDGFHYSVWQREKK